MVPLWRSYGALMELLWSPYGPYKALMGALMSLMGALLEALLGALLGVLWVLAALPEACLFDLMTWRSLCCCSLAVQCDLQGTCRVALYGPLRSP